jgi:hypothetical protein
MMMKKTAKLQHTPGPWTLTRPSHPLKGIEVCLWHKDAISDVIRVGIGGGPHEVRAEDMANARLIKSAPKLLEAMLAFREAVGPLSPRLKLSHEQTIALDHAMMKSRMVLAMVEGHADCEADKHH